MNFTSYYLDLVGSSGVTEIIKIYLNHILDPILSEEEFQKEIYKSPTSEEEFPTGVLYLEMESIYSRPGVLMERAINKLIYSYNNKNSILYGIGHYQGGLPQYIPELTIESLREYHNFYYKESKISIIIIGNIDHDDTVDKIAEYMKSKNYMKKYKQENELKLKNIVKDVEIPDLKLIKLPEIDQKEILTQIQISISMKGPELSNRKEVMILNI